MRLVKPLQCKWNSLELKVLRLTDSFGRQWTKHAYPGRDWVEWEPGGILPPRFDVEILFNGPSWLSDLMAFREEIWADSHGKFKHPWWGTHDGICQNLVVTTFDRKEDYAEVRFSFVAGSATTFAFSTADTLSTAAAAVSVAATSASAALAGLAS